MLRGSSAGLRDWSARMHRLRHGALKPLPKKRSRLDCDSFRGRVGGAGGAGGGGGWAGRVCS